MYSKKIKIIAGVLVFMLCVSYVSTITKIGQVLAAGSTVVFRASFTTVKKTTEANVLSTQVTIDGGGYLEDAKVEIEDPNFTIIEAIGAKNVTEENGLTTIYYNTISSSKVFSFPVKFANKNKVSTDELNKTMNARLTATHVNNSGTRQTIQLTSSFSLAWTVEQAQSTMEPEINTQVSRFIPYQVGSNKGVIIEEIIATRLPDNALPVKDSKMIVYVPEINGILPTSVTVKANSTAATNGDTTGETFTNANYTVKDIATSGVDFSGLSDIDPNGKVLLIDVKNDEDENGKVSWLKGVYDEFVITYKYPETAYTAYTNNTNSSLYTFIHNTVDTYYYGQTDKYSAHRSMEIPTVEVGEIVDLSAYTSVDKLYVNFNKENKINFTEKLKIDIADASLVDTAIVTAGIDRFDGYDGAIANTYYKNVGSILSETNLNKILDLLKIDGTVVVKLVYADGTEKLSTITKTAEGFTGTVGAPIAGEEEKIVKQIKIELTDIAKAGIIEIDLEKEGIITPSSENIKLFTEAKIEGTASGTSVTEKYAVKQINLVEPETQAELNIENSTLSTKVDTNKNVKLTAVLKTDTTSTKLYKDPVLKITLPSYVETVNLKNVEVLFDTEASKLTKKSQTVVENSDGTKSIVIELEGTQTEYTLNAVSKGVNVVVTADIALNKLTASQEDVITMEYTNNNGTPETKTTRANIDVVAPVGIITATTIDSYSANGAAVTAMNGEDKVATLDVLAESRNANYTMNIVNNYTNEIKNISILGRFPVKGAKNIETDEDLGSTFDMLPSSITVNGIDASKVKVYYSPRSSATTDLTSTYNEWSETMSSYNMETGYKSYLIVLDPSVVLNKADKLSFTYSVNVPSDLQYNESAYETYAVYFDNEAEGITGDKEIVTKLGASTGKGPILEASLSSSKAETEEVQSGEVITYTLKVKNTGTETAKNTIAKLTAPTGLDYISADGKIVAASGNEVELNIGDIPAGSEVEANLLFKANLTSADQTVSTTITVVEEKGIQAETNTVSNRILGVDFNVATTILKENDVVEEGDKITYYFSIKPTTYSNTIENGKMEIVLPEELEYESAKLVKGYLKNEENIEGANINYNSSSRKLTIDLGDIESTKGKAVYLYTKVGKLVDGVYDKNVNIDTKLSGDNARAQVVNTEEIEIGKVGFKIEQTSNIPQNTHITAGEDLKYVFSIENLSNIELYNVKFTDMLPEGLKIKNIEATTETGNTETSVTNELELFMLKGREKATIEVNAAADIMDTTVKAVNKGTIEYNSVVGTIIKETSSEYTIYVEKFEASNNPSGGDSSDPTLTKRIMGTVWEDANANGTREESEKLISGVQLMLFNNNTGDLVRDSQGNVIRVLTDETGTYTFAGLGTGSYTVVFLYDTANYSATTYRKEGVDETLNSDGVDTMITMDGTSRMAAITEPISISDKNIYAIDLGLVSNPKFDLKLDKVVSKITVQDSNGTNVIEYNDSKVAKKDLVGSEVENTTIVVEYKIKVTNEGAISGYVKKIADYMPKEMKFNSEVNKDWYAADNGTLYNSSLANILINPGETKEVTLVLTKKMSNDNLGVYHNEAEIYEAYNDLGIADIDSTAGNKKAAEDDISSADVVITVKTGEVAIFIGASIAIIATIAVAAYIIKKKVIR